MGKLRPWLMRVGLVIVGALVGSLALEQFTLLTIWGFVDNPHDVQTIVYQVLVSFWGGVLGGVTVISILLARHHFLKMTGALSLLFGGMGTALALWTLLGAERGFDTSQQPFLDALAYCGPTLVFSLSVFILGLLLLDKSNKPIIQAQI